MASTYLTRTPSSAGNKQKFTISAWIKKASVGSAAHTIMCASNGGNRDAIMFDNNKLAVFKYDSGYTYQLRTTRLFRDSNAFYHIVVAYDTTQATASNRIKIYINGEQATSFESGWETYPSQNFNTLFNDAFAQIIGKDWDSSNYFDGNISHFHLTDGYAYAASDFGETDSTTGIWKPKTAPSVTYGTNGFFLKFENSAAMGTDSAGSNNFTVGGGTMTQLIDTPDNVFSTLDALQDYYGWHDLSNANTSVTFSGSSRYGISLSNLGVTSGKYYCEIKCVAEGSPKGLSIGLVNKDIGFGQYEYLNGNGYAYWRAGNGVVRDNASNTEYTGNTWGTGDILMMALDCDNRNLYFGKNGTWENSGVPTSGSTGTGAVTLSTLSAYPDYPFFFACDRNDSGNPQFSWNFGNGFFGTTAVSSAQNPDDGIGIFEYDVPAGYRALCTKSINAEEYS